MGVDSVIMATGYSFSFPQLEGGQLVPVRDNRILLYKLMFPPDLAPKVREIFIGTEENDVHSFPFTEHIGHHWAHPTHWFHHANLRDASPPLLCPAGGRCCVA